MISAYSKAPPLRVKYTVRTSIRYTDDPYYWILTFKQRQYRLGSFAENIKVENILQENFVALYEERYFFAVSSHSRHIPHDERTIDSIVLQ